MYQGSMIGAGAVVFAVMGFVISNQVPDADVGSQVELNPKLLAFILGEPEEKITEAIKFLCAKDDKSRTPDCDGRRLIKLGEYAYQVVNGATYNSMRNEDDRRRQNREAKRRERARVVALKKSKPSPGETDYVKTLENEGQAAADAQMDAAQSNGHPKELSATEKADLEYRKSIGLA